MLGHWHRIEGPVLHGEKRGRELGYPTANMSVDGLHPPAFGVYAVLVDVLNGPHEGQYTGAASLGVRPMFDGEQANLETFLFDFSGDETNFLGEEAIILGDDSSLSPLVSSFAPFIT
jgi:riboflavin kinase/FMN adenylyltransferase